MVQNKKTEMSQTELNDSILFLQNKFSAGNKEKQEENQSQNLDLTPKYNSECNDIEINIEDTQSNNRVENLEHFKQNEIVNNK
jgi:hypothetical protein